MSDNIIDRVSAEQFLLVSGSVVRGSFTTSRDGTLIVGSSVDPDALTITAENSSITSRRFSLRRAFLRLGADGDDGDIALFGGGNKSAENPTVEPLLRLNASDSSITGQRFLLSSILRLGANNDDGDITLYRGSNTSIVNPSEEPSIRLNADNSSITGQRFLLSSILRLGAGGDDGDITLFRSSNISVENPSEEPSIRLNGDSGDIILQNADCAEDFEIDSLEAVEPGTVMVIGENSYLKASRQAYDRRVAGIVAGAGQYRPGIILGRNRKAENSLPIALIGRVNCKVDASYGCIKIGDLLTASPTCGHAMKVMDFNKAFGAIIGKALGELDSGTGMIPILVALQ